MAIIIGNDEVIVVENPEPKEKDGMDKMSDSKEMKRRQVLALHRAFGHLELYLPTEPADKN